MKISQIDRKILELLKLEPNYLNQIAHKLERSPSQIYFRLKKLTECSIIEKRKGYPVIYKLNFNKYESPIYRTISCHKCKNIEMVESTQQTRVCKKCKARYWISKYREREAQEILLGIHREGNNAPTNLC